MEAVCFNRPTVVKEPFLLRQILIRKSTKRRRFMNGRISAGRIVSTMANSWASQFQDLKTFARPLRLLTAGKANIHPSTEETISQFEYLYSIQLHTSTDTNSGLHVSESAVLVCLIAEDGDSILLRIPSISSDISNNLEVASDVDRVCFQRGSVDHLTFHGPKLSKIEAVWVGVESGRWKLHDISLAIISKQYKLSPDDGKPISCSGMHYIFGTIDISIGDGGDVSMAELRPCNIMELSTINLLDLPNIHPRGDPLQTTRVSLEDGMKEYDDLKFSMLLYDLMLILGGTYALATSTSDGTVDVDVFLMLDRTAFTFLIGGICGFLYLFNLQRTVDNLTPSSSMETSSPTLGQKVSESVPTAAVIVVFGLLASKYLLQKVNMVFTAEELLALVSGFFTYKLAVVAAAFHPLSSLRKIK